jgi:hypothetical protein
MGMRRVQREIHGLLLEERLLKGRRSIPPTFPSSLSESDPAEDVHHRPVETLEARRTDDGMGRAHARPEAGRAPSLRNRQDLWMKIIRLRS